MIDILGILDRFFEDRNIIEMCSIIVLVYFRVVVFFFLDIFGLCGYIIV